MRTLKILTLIFYSSLAFAAYDSKWISMKSYKPQAEHEKVLVALKDWASVKYLTNNGKYNFEYAIEKNSAGFKAKVTPLYINSDGKYLYMVDGEMCLNINNELKVVESYQCAFPPYHPKNSQ